MPRDRKFAFFSIFITTLVLTTLLSLQIGYEWYNVILGFSFILSGSLAYALTPQDGKSRLLSAMELPFAKIWPSALNFYLINSGLIIYLYVKPVEHKFWPMVSLVLFDILMCIFWKYMHNLYQKKLTEYIRERQTEYIKRRQETL